MQTDGQGQAGPVAIVDYDARWPGMFQEEKQRIRAAVGRRFPVIEHIGSTAVPGLGAKPIIDIMPAIRSLKIGAECIELLGGIGYEYVPEFESVLPERRFLIKASAGDCGYHLHVVEASSGFWERLLLFRDFLRAHPEVARQYHELKRRLAVEYAADREGYTEAKTPFIESAVARARASR